jgi:hypothetical protein
MRTRRRNDAKRPTRMEYLRLLHAVDKCNLNVERLKCVCVDTALGPRHIYLYTLKNATESKSSYECEMEVSRIRTGYSYTTSRTLIARIKRPTHAPILSTMSAPRSMSQTNTTLCLSCQYLVTSALFYAPELKFAFSCGKRHKGGYKTAYVAS